MDLLEDFELQLLETLRGQREIIMVCSQPCSYSLSQATALHHC